MRAPQFAVPAAPHEAHRLSNPHKPRLLTLTPTPTHSCVWQFSKTLTFLRGAGLFKHVNIDKACRDTANMYNTGRVDALKKSGFVIGWIGAA